MTCRGIDDAINSRTGDSALPIEAAEHISACGSCRSLVRLLDQNDPSQPSPRVARIRARLIESLAPVRPLPSTRVLLCAVGLIFLTAVGLGVLQLGINGVSTLTLGQSTIVFSTLIAGVLLLGQSVVRQMVPGSKAGFSPAVLQVVILIGFVSMVGFSFRPQGEPSFVASGIMCMKNGLTYCLLCGLLVWLLLRRGAILFPKLAGAAAGGFSGLAGLCVLEVNCANVNLFHILVWHWGVVLIGSLAGTALGAVAEQVDRRSNQRIPRL